MKRYLFGLLAASLLLSSCFGNFKLTNKLYHFNQNVGKEPLKTAVFIAFNIAPVYGICLIADALVLNTVEYWQGDNPVDAKIELGGEKYAVSQDANQFTFTNLQHEEKTFKLINNPETGVWVLENGNKTFKAARIDDKTLTVYYQDGSLKCVPLP